MIPMPSPRGTNKARAYIIPTQIDQRTAMALDQGGPSNGSRSQSGRLSPDLVDPLKNGASDDERDDPRSRLMNWIDQKIESGNDQEVAGLLQQLEGHGAAGEQRKGEGFSLDDQVANLSRFLRGKGLDDLAVKTACDLARRAWGRDQELGIGKSAKFGGSFGGGQGGNLHGERDQPELRALSDPGAKDFMTYEEMTGCEPARPRGDSRRFGRDSRMGFDYVFGLLPTLEAREAERTRRRRSDRQLGMDARAVDSFNARFPNAARIKPAY
jgi:hypothetical protein